MAPSAVAVEDSQSTSVTAAEPARIREDETHIAKAAARPAQSHEEYQYLNLIRDILNNGEHRPDR